MFRFNLNRTNHSSKWFGRKTSPAAGLLILLSLAIASCSGDNDSLIPEDFSYNGSYYLIKISRTSDGVSFEELSAPDVGGVIIITGTSYSRETSISESQETEEGTLEIFDNIIIFTLRGTGEQIRGTYDIKDETITMNYTLGGYLYTETWKRVELTENPA